MRSGSAAEDGPDRRGVLRRVAAREVPRRAPGQSDCLRIPLLSRYVPGAHVEQEIGAARGGLVPARLAVNDERALDRETRQRLRHQRRHLGAEGAHDHERRLGGIGQRSQDVEYRPNAESLPDGHQGLHRRVIVRREQEREARFAQALTCPNFVQRKAQPEGLEDVRASAAAGHGPVAVLHHRQACRRREQSRTGGQVEASRPVSARADDVDRLQAIGKGGPAREPPHRPREPPNLLRRLALQSQPCQESPGNGGRQTILSQLCHQRGGLVLGQVVSVEQAIEKEIHESLPATSKSRKFRRSRSPSGVRMLSGWNCTPSARSVRWRTPMISPSDV